MHLKFDSEKWKEIIAKPARTLQLFITNKCNKRCDGCFYQKRLGKGEMSFREYVSYINRYKRRIDKVILLGGEPTMHPDLRQMLIYNKKQNLKTTIYSNGFSLEKLTKKDLIDNETTLRIGVLGLHNHEKKLSEIETDLPVTIVYMLRKNNVAELPDAATYSEKNFNCEGFYISSIRDISRTNDYWVDTEETIPLKEYAQTIQAFLDSYNGKIKKLHISKRGALETENSHPLIDKCRFFNIFPNGDKIICPFDISKEILAENYDFKSRNCNKNLECLLQKIVLQNIK